MTAKGGLSGSLGVMQGRLSPMIFGGYQAFPTDLWMSEFCLARQRGLQHIEWVLDAPSIQCNPILTDPESVSVRTRESDVRVVSVCADFLMTHPLDVNRKTSWDTVEKLLASMVSIGAEFLVIPCVDQSSVLTGDSRCRLTRALHRLEDLISGSGIRISLETDLPPAAFRDLLAEFDPDHVGANFDIGNSASLGYDPSEELDVYGTRVNLLHVKDRILNGASVPLGAGAANLPLVLSSLIDLDFDGPVTLQCFRDQDGVAVFDEQLCYYRRLVEELGDGS